MPMISDSARSLAASLLIMSIIIGALYFGKALFIPLALSAILAFILTPVVAWLMERSVPRGAAVGGIVGLCVALFAVAAIGFSAQMLSVTTALDANKQNLVSKLRDITGKDAKDGILGRATRSFAALEKAISNELNTAEKKDGAQAPVVVKDEAANQSTSSVKEFAGAAVGPLATFLVTILFTAFLLLQNHDLRDRIVRVLGTDNMSGTASALSEAGNRLGQVFLGQAMLNASFGLFIAIALWLVGVPNPFLWGVTAGLLRFVPYIGAILASLPPLLLAAAVDPGWGMFAATAAIFLISEPILGHVLEPLVLGKRAGLSPFAMVISASFWTLIWGPVGLLLAAPLTLVLVVIGENIPQLSFLSILLGDKPALDPETQFYHRLLSNDPAYALEQIESASDNQSLPAVSDAIILPALRIAALDRKRGRIGAEQMDAMRKTMQEISVELAEQVDATAKGKDNALETIIIPARGTIDVIASHYVADILNASGIGRVIALEKSAGLLALSSIQSDVDTPPKSIVLSSAGSLDSKHLNFLAARAAQSFPTAKVIVCNWGQPKSDNTVNPPNGGPATLFCASLNELIWLLRLDATELKI